MAAEDNVHQAGSRLDVYYSLNSIKGGIWGII